MKMIISLSAVNNWYGLRARPAGPSAVPDGHNNILTSEEALKHSALKGVRVDDIRHGAISYPSPLSEYLIKSFELVDFSKGIVNYDARTKEAKESVMTAILDRTLEKAEYLESKVTDSKVVGATGSITLRNKFKVKFGYKGNEIHVLGFPELKMRVKDEVDLEEFSDQLFYLMEDNQ